MGGDLILFGVPFTSQTLFIGAVIILVFYRIQKLITSNNNDIASPNELPTREQTLKLLLSRRTIMPKEYITGGQITDEDIDSVLEAANWVIIYLLD